MEFNPILYNEKYRIPTVRYKHCEYGEGFYHVVLCSKERKCYFGEIKDGRITFSPIGEYAQKDIEQWQQYNDNVSVHASQVMPNHIHLLLQLTGDSKLPFVVRGFKRAITLWCRKQQLEFDWQGRYYETIIRDAAQYNETKYYIAMNVANWHEDEKNRK